MVRRSAGPITNGKGGRRESTRLRRRPLWEVPEFFALGKLAPKLLCGGSKLRDACVPSIKRPALLPEFADRVAAALGVPFLPVVAKVKENDPQKEQENAFHQCRNLDGVFRIDGECLSGSVLLLDDIYDSGWTMTVMAALLRQKGSGPVFPVALTAAS